jgi:hypothetical protein
MKTEFQLCWKRVGQRPKKKIFQSRKAAEHYRVLFGPEPWKYFGRDPDARVCCSGYECGCEGVTVRSESDDKRSGMPEIEWIAIRVRAVSDWVEESREVLVDPALGENETDAGREDDMANRMAGVKTGLDASNDLDHIW